MKRKIAGVDESMEGWIRENHLEYTSLEMAQQLGLTRLKVNEVLSRRGLKRDTNIWSKSEKEYVMKHAKTKTYREIGEALGRSEDAVRKKAKDIGVEMRKYPSDPTPEEIAKATEEIRKTWTEEDYIRRSVRITDAYTIPQYKVRSSKRGAVMEGEDE